MSENHVGFEEMKKYPFFEVLFKRRSRRISARARLRSSGNTRWNRRSSTLRSPLLQACRSRVISPAGGDIRRSVIGVQFITDERGERNKRYGDTVLIPGVHLYEREKPVAAAKKSHAQASAARRKP